jgi:hypothetical protein
MTELWDPYRPGTPGPNFRGKDTLQPVLGGTGRVCRASGLQSRVCGREVGGKVPLFPFALLVGIQSEDQSYLRNSRGCCYGVRRPVMLNVSVKT